MTTVTSPDIESPSSPREDQPRGFILEAGRRIPSAPRMRCEGCGRLLELGNALVAWESDYEAASEYVQPVLLCKLTPEGNYGCSNHMPYKERHWMEAASFLCWQLMNGGARTKKAWARLFEETSR